MFCPRCGAQAPDGSRFCQKCGANVQATPVTPRQAPTQPYVPPAAPQSFAPPQQPYSPPYVPQQQPFAAAPGYPQPGQPAWATPANFYAGFWLRWVAYLIDGLLLGVVCVIIYALLMVATGIGVDGHDINPAGVILVFLVVLATIVGVWLYFAKMESSPRQATLGKSALSLRVTDMNGQRLSFGHASGRFFAKIVTALIPFAIGWIIAGFTEKKQAVHDFIAGTLVVRNR